MSHLPTGLAPTPAPQYLIARASQDAHWEDRWGCGSRGGAGQKTGWRDGAYLHHHSALHAGPNPELPVPAPARRGMVPGRVSEPNKPRGSHPADAPPSPPPGGSSSSRSFLFFLKSIFFPEFIFHFPILPAPCALAFRLTPKPQKEALGVAPRPILVSSPQGLGRLAEVRRGGERAGCPCECHEEGAPESRGG